MNLVEFELVVQSSNTSSFRSRCLMQNVNRLNISLYNPWTFFVFCKTYRVKGAIHTVNIIYLNAAIAKQIWLCLNLHTYSVAHTTVTRGGREKRIREHLSEDQWDLSTIRIQILVSSDISNNNNSIYIRPQWTTPQITSSSGTLLWYK